MLRALDGSSAGVSHREIAELLLRESRSKADRTYFLAIIWETHSPPPGGAATRSRTACPGSPLLGRNGAHGAIRQLANNAL
ncbi:hypothetical protein [Mesorhizobium sp. M0136]|uniref:hypothetical protein n=1 Tax=Mesorhizobium sp. M0136 TaxID=2956890 RepID=UPI0033357359